MQNLILFLKNSFLSYKALFGWLDFKIYVLVKILNPILMLSFFSLLAKYFYGPELFVPYVINNAVVLCIWNSIYGVGIVLAAERSYGTLKNLIAVPTNKFVIFVGRAFMHIIDGLFSVVLGLGIGIIFFGLSFNNTNIFQLSLAIIISVCAVSGFGLMLGSFCLMFRDTQLVTNCAAFALMALCGVNFPVSYLPWLVQKISYALPLTRGLQAIEKILSGSSGYHLILLELLVGVTYIIVGYIMLIFMERMSVKNGNFDLY